MNLSYFLLGSSGSIYTDIDGTLDLAFNDNFYVDNSGYFNFNLFSGNTLIGTKQVLGNYSDWQTAFNLPANANYTYSADGYVYDDYGNLRFVLPPKVVAQTGSVTDQRNRFATEDQARTQHRGSPPPHPQ